MKKLLIILIITTLLGCDKSDNSDNSNELIYGYNIDVSIEFSVLNSQNEDLLNPENPNHLDVKKIKLFYIIDGEKKGIYNTFMDNPRNFRVYEHENEYRIGVSLNLTETSEKPITYIQWNDTDTDTIEVTIKRTPHSTLSEEIWLNGMHVWERGNNTIDPYFVLRK
jgi:hypothetical protein